MRVHTILHLLVRTGLTCTLAAHAGFADVHTVDDDGPADFADIQPAVDASTTGDAILVMPGTYSGFTLDGVGLSILGMPTAEVVGEVRIRNVGSPEVVVLSNLRLRGQASRALVLLDNPGKVRVQSCELFGFQGFEICEPYDWESSRTAALVQNCADMFFADCVLRGGHGVSSPHCYDHDGGSGVEGASFVGSNVALYDCELYGGEGDGTHSTWSGSYAGDGGDGCRVNGGFVFASNTVFKGGRGGDVDCEFSLEIGYGGDGGVGLYFLPDYPTEAKLLDCSYIGGAGGTAWGGDGFWCVSGYGGTGIWNPSSSSIELLEGESRTMEIEHWVLGGNTVQATFHGFQGDTVYLPFDAATGFAYDAALKGVWQLATPPADLGVPIGVIPASGMLSAVITLPEPAAGESVGTTFRQAYIVDRVGNPILATPDSTTVLEDCAVASYCIASPNSVSAGTTMSSTGSTSVSANDFTLVASGAPPDQFGIFFYGPGQEQVAFGNGYLCVAGDALGLFRLNPPRLISAGGSTFRPVDLTDPPEPDGRILAGSTWSFQFWYRDPLGGGALFNLSDGLRATFCP